MPYFFEDSIEELLQRCGKYSETKSVLIMDNASFTYINRFEVPQLRDAK